MATWRNPDQLIKAVADALKPFLRRNYCKITTGKVTDTFDDGTASVTVNGSSLMAVRCCYCAKGNVVLIVSQASNHYVIGVRQTS